MDYGSDIDDISADLASGLRVSISDDLSEDSTSDDQPDGSTSSGLSASYGEDSQWVADKGYRTCVSNHRRHAIHWKRGEQIGMGSFGKVRRVRVVGVGLPTPEE